MIQRLAASVLCIVACAVPAGAERLPLRNYTTADGLPNNVVNRIVRDSRGFVWFCTNEGLSRFDGYGFTNYGLREGLPGALVHDLLETRNGVYWVATSRGLARFDPLAGPRPMFTTVLASDDRLTRQVTSLHEDGSGQLWAGTLGGLFRLETETGRVAAGPIRMGNAEVVALEDDSAGTLWIATRVGLYRRWPNGRIDQQALPKAPIQHVTALLFEHGRLWVGTSGIGLVLFDIDRASGASTLTDVLDVSRGLPSVSVTQFLMRADRSVVVATWGGAVEFAGGRPGVVTRTYRSVHGLSEDAVQTVSEDLRRHLWIGTRFGVAKVLPARFTLFDAADGMKWASSIIETREGKV